MSIKSKIAGFIMRKALHYSILEMCGFNADHAGAKTDIELIAKIRGWSWACIDKNAKACAQVPLRLYTTSKTAQTKGIKTVTVEKGKHAFLHTKLAERVSASDTLEEITDHPILDLLRRVNPNDNAFDLKELTVKYLEAIGVDYWWLHRGVGGEIINIWPLQSQYVTIKLTKNEKRIASYEYRINKHTSNFNPKDIVHFKYTSMRCPLKGDSPTKAAEQSIDLNEAMNQYEIANFKNGGNPSVVLEVPVDGTIKPEEKKRIKSDFRANTGGVKNTGNLMIASGGAKIHEYGHKPKDMNFVQGRKTTLEEICGTYGVPMTFVVPTEISRDNLRSSIKLWMQFTINPKLTMIEQKLNEQFTPNWGDDLFLLFDDAIPADKEQRLKEIETLINTKYSSINEERAKDGVDPAPWGDEPIEPRPIEVEEVEEPEAKKQVKREGQTSDLPEPDFMPRLFLVAMVRTYRAMEADIVKGLKNYDNTKAIEDDASDAAFAGSAEDIVSSVFNEAKWAEEIAENARPFVRGLLDIGLVEAMEKVKPDAMVNTSSATVLNAMDERMGQIRSAATTIERELRDGISESINLGESRSRTIKRVRDNFDTRAKADRVVRTETIWAHNEGTVIAWEQSGVVGAVKWNTVPDDRRCPYCASMHGKTKTLGGTWFEKGTSLTVTGDAGTDITLKFGYEPIKHPPLHPNCLTKDCLVSASTGITAVSKRLYNGNVFIFKTATGREFTCTPNHPILTRGGFVRADALDVGSEVVAHGLRNGETFADWKDINTPTTAEDIAETFLKSGGVFSEEVPVAAPDFHGDGTGSKVAIIGSNSLLMDSFNPSGSKHPLNSDLVFREVRRILLNRGGVLDLSFDSDFSANKGLMGISDLVFSLTGRHLTPLELIGLTTPSGFNSIFSNEGFDSVAGEHEFFGQSVYRPSFDVKIDNFNTDFCADFVTHKRVLQYNDYVYNFMTPSSYYIAGGVASHNCRCQQIPIISD